MRTRGGTPPVSFFRDEHKLGRWFLSKRRKRTRSEKDSPFTAKNQLQTLYIIYSNRVFTAIYSCVIQGLIK